MAKKRRSSTFSDWEEALLRQHPPTDPIPETEADEPMPADVSPPTETLPHDVHLLERARTQWQFGEWQALAALDANALNHHPDRARLALLAAAGCAQTGQIPQAQKLARKSVDWGADRDLVKRLLLSGVHNSLARAAALAGQDKRVRRHFEDALNVGVPGGAAPMAVRARAESELTQIGLEQTLPRLIPATPQPSAPSYLKRTVNAAGQDLLVFLPGRKQRLVTLFPDQPGFVKCHEDRLLFNVPEGRQLVFSTHPEGQLSTPPLADLFGLAAATEYRVSGHLACADPSAMALLIEYDDQERIADHAGQAVAHRFDLRIRTHWKHRRLCMAFRVSGRGELDLGVSVLRFQQIPVAMTASDTAIGAD